MIDFILELKPCKKFKISKFFDLDDEFLLRFSVQTEGGQVDRKHEDLRTKFDA